MNVRETTLTDQEPQFPQQQQEAQRQALEAYMDVQRRMARKHLDDWRADPERPEHGFPPDYTQPVPNVAWGIGPQIIWTHGGLTVDEWRAYKAKHRAISAEPGTEDHQFAMLELYADIAWPVISRSNPKLTPPVQSAADVCRLLSPRALWAVGNFLSDASSPLPPVDASPPPSSTA